MLALCGLYGIIEAIWNPCGLCTYPLWEYGFPCWLYVNHTGIWRQYGLLVGSIRIHYGNTPLLRDVLRWLPVPFRIEYKVCLLVFQSPHGAAPEYLRDCCTATHSSASGLRLRSLERTDLRVRRMRTHFGDRAFS